MIIDEELCCIGSVNMDIRSFQIDDEICGIFYDNQFVDYYLNIANEDIINSKEYTYEENLNRGNKEKILESIFLLLSPLM